MSPIDEGGKMDQMAAKPTLLNKSYSNQKILADLLFQL